MADKAVEILMREALKNAESGSAFITLNPTLGSSMETVLFSTTKGSKILAGVGIELMLDSSAFTSYDVTYMLQMIDDLMIKIDNQLRVRSSDTVALREWANTVLDKDQYDDVPVGAGTGNDGGHCFYIIPVSGVGGRQCQVDIDLTAYASLMTGTYRSSYVIITPFYTDMPMPIFSCITGTATPGGTGVFKLQLSGDFIGNGFLESGVIVGDGTFVNDDFRIMQEDGKMLLNQKERFDITVISSALRQYWQNLHNKTLVDDSSGFRICSTLPWTINSSIEFDVVTAGTFHYAFVFKNSPTSTRGQYIEGEPATPTPEPQMQPYTVAPVNTDTRNVGAATAPVGQRSGQLLQVGKTGVKRLLGLQR